MTIILRLQGLDVKAGTEDIRKFFKCLHIPDGGVYVVGGRLREAFIAFTTERDAQRAMQYTGNFLKGAKVTLHRSNMVELELKLESLIVKKKHSRTTKRPPPSPDADLPSLNTSPHDHNANPPLSTVLTSDPNDTNKLQHQDTNFKNPQTSAVQSLDCNTAFLLGVCTVLQELQSTIQSGNNEAAPRVDSQKADSTVIVSNVKKTLEPTVHLRPGYVRLFGLPPSATKDDICQFFRGLAVQEAIVNVKLGLGHGCLVKFENEHDACNALHFNQKPLGSICVEVRGATEKMWTSALQECESVLDDGERESVKPHQNPHEDTVNHKQIAKKRLPVSSWLHKSPKKTKPDCDTMAALSPSVEHVVMVSNIPKKMTKTEIKELFRCPELAHKNVLHLLDKEGNRTDRAFLIFNSTDDYEYAINLTGCHVGSDTIEVSSITKQEMRNMMAKTLPRNRMHCFKMDSKKKPYQKSEALGILEETPSMSLDPAARTCLLVRNMPADVRRSQIKSFFCKYKLREDNIILLHDSDGRGSGEAVVQFESERLAALAHRLHGQEFLGTQVLLTCITMKQMEDVLARSA